MDTTVRVILVTNTFGELTVEKMRFKLSMCIIITTHYITS
jgi:hypothetical protein